MLLVTVQVDGRFIFIQRRNDCFLDKFSIQFRIQQHVLYSARNILVLLALHQRVPAELRTCTVSIQNVPILVVGIDDA